jgi:hypothetical protein
MRGLVHERARSVTNLNAHTDIAAHRITHTATWWRWDRGPRSAAFLHINLIELAQRAQRVDDSGTDHWQDAHTAAALRLRMRDIWSDERDAPHVGVVQRQQSILIAKEHERTRRHLAHECVIDQRGRRVRGIGFTRSAVTRHGAGDAVERANSASKSQQP